MFESHSEKGLFTFYWEQSHPGSLAKTPRESPVNEIAAKEAEKQKMI